MIGRVSAPEPIYRYERVSGWDRVYFTFRNISLTLTRTNFWSFTSQGEYNLGRIKVYNLIIVLIVLIVQFDYYTLENCNRKRFQ